MDQINSFLSALLGTAVSAYIAKLYITKALRDLEAALKMCHEIEKKLSGIEVRLVALDDLSELSLQHDRQITALQTRTSGKYNKHSTNGANGS